MQNKQANLLLPILDIEAPVLLDDEGMPYIPAAFFSRLLGLNHTAEMRRVQHIMLRYEMRHFLVQRPQQRCVWAFRYPFGLAAWLGNVYERVTDPAWKAKVMPFIKWGMRLWGQAFQQMQQDFIQMRKNMYALASTIDDLEKQMQRLRKIARRLLPEQQERLHHLDAHWGHLSEQTRTFIQRWLAEKNALPIVQTFVVKDGEVEPDSPAVSLFATVSDEDITALNGYTQAIGQWTRELDDFLDNLPFSPDKEY